MEKEKKKSKLLIIIGIVAVVIIAIIAIAVLGKNNMSKEKMLEMAKELKYTELNTAMKENQNRAKENYIGNIYTFSAFITEIADNYITMSDAGIKVYMDKDTIKTLDNGQKITIVGKINKLDYEEKESMSMGYSYTSNIISCEMINGYLVNDIFEITGVVDIPSKKLTIYTKDASNVVAEKKETHGIYTDITRYDNEWYCTVKDNNGTTYNLNDLVATENRKFSDQGKTIIDNVEIQEKSNITIVGRIKKEDSKIKIKDIQSITLNK